MALSTQRNAIVSWVRAVTSLDAGHVIWADQDAPKPSKPFVALRLTAGGRTGLDSVGDPNNSGVAVVVSHNNFTLSIRYFGNTSNDPIEKLLDLRHSLSHVAHYKILQDANIAFSDELMGPTDLSVAVDTNFERKGAMDLLIRIPWSTSDSGAGVISTVNVDGSAVAADAITIYQGSITINPL